MSTKKNAVWSLEMRTFTVEAYLRTNSYVSAMAKFEQKFNIGKTPGKSVIVKWVKKFREEGTVRDLRSPTPGRNTNSGCRKILNEEDIDNIRFSVEKSPKKSIRRRAQELGLGRTTMHNAMRSDLRLLNNPYSLTVSASIKS